MPMLTPAARIASLYRYPIKGFAGQKLAAATLSPGRGLPFDRFLGIANGSLPISESDWTIYNAFVRLALNPQLLGFDLGFDEEVLRLSLEGGDGRRIETDLTNAADLAALNAQLASWFPNTPAPPQLARRHDDLGWWDCSDAPISLINIASVEELAQTADVPLDPVRFRGNLYLEDLPAWAEFDFIGQRLRIGEAELEISRPMERCSATSANPLLGQADCNVPALLGRNEGHLMCGVYAQVVSPGRVQPGDAVIALGHQPRIWQMGVDYMDAPPTRKWPRFAEVVRVVEESPEVRSYWLRDPASLIRPDLLPGQHLRLHLPAQEGQPLWRSYTISGSEEDLIRLTIRRQGTAPLWLETEAKPGARLLISGPFGEFTLPEPADRPLVLISAGIGITPILSMLKAAATSGEACPAIHLIHTARDAGSLALWGEVEAIAETLPQLSTRLVLSQVPGQPASRIDAGTLADLPLDVADVMICGPMPFMEAMRELAYAAGADPERVRFEVFASPAATSSAPRAATTDGPWQVDFAQSERRIEWGAPSGSLLEAAEAAGQSLSANCRSGVCGACRVKLLAGRVEHLLDAPFPLAPDDVLTCCAVPLSDVVLAR